MCDEELDDKYGDLFVYTNYLFMFIYTYEAVAKVCLSTLFCDQKIVWVIDFCVCFSQMNNILLWVGGKKICVPFPGYVCLGERGLMDKSPSYRTLHICRKNIHKNQEPLCLC